MNSHNAIVDLSTIAIPLTTSTHGLFAAFSRARLIHTTNGLWVGMVFGDDLLASIS